LSEDLTLISKPSKTLIIEPAFLIFPTVTIPSFAPTSIILINSVAIPTFAPTLTTLIVSVLVIAELTLLFTPKIAAALSPATYIPTEP
jgi:hypothetical protein